LLNFGKADGASTRTIIEQVALQAEASHGATYLAMLTERAVAVSRLMGLPESIIQIHLHEFRDPKRQNDGDGTSLWSRLHQERHVELPSGLKIRLFSCPRVRTHHHVYAHLSRLLVRLKGLKATRSAHRSIAETCEALLLKFSGVVIGDLVLSTALRSDPGSIAEPHRTQRLPRLLAEGAARAAFAAKHRDDLEAAAVTAIWCTPEASYLQAILPRAATQKRSGLQLVDDAEGFISLIRANNLPAIPPLLIVPAEGETDRTWASKHLHSRLQALEERTENEAKENPLTGLSRESSNRIDVVVFLHDFADGEFMNGFDGLGSNYQWAEFTLTNLVQDSNLTIYVKPHPAIRVESTFGRKVSGLITSLQANISGSINWLTPVHSPQTQMRLGSSVGITRYGTVAEELTFRGIPVIASKNAPYSAHNFATHWVDLASYSEILQDLRRIARDGVSRSQKDACLDYVYRRHANWPPPFWERAVQALTERQDLSQSPGSWYELEDFLQAADAQSFYDLVTQTSFACPVIDRRHIFDVSNLSPVSSSPLSSQM